MSSEYLIFASVVIVGLMAATLWIRQLNRRARLGLLSTLAVSDPANRERILARFTPKVQVELRLQLQQYKRATNVPPRPLQSWQWFAYLAATKGSLIHRLLSGVLILFLFFGMFGGAFAGYFLNQHLHGDHPSGWAGAMMEVGLMGAIFGWVSFRFWVLGIAFRRYLTRFEASRKSHPQ